MEKDLCKWIALLVLSAAVSACGDDGGSISGAAGGSASTTTGSSAAGATSSGSVTPATGASGSQAAKPSSTTGTSTASPTSKVKLSSATYSVNATAGTAVLAVERLGSSGATKIEYSTANGSGVTGVDYTAAAGSLTWSDGDTSVKKIYVPVRSNGSGKTFIVHLAAGSSNATVATPSAATVTITAPAEAIPPAAEQAGYNTQTFGPALSVGENWHSFTFYGSNVGQTGGVNQSNGTVLISGEGSGTISTATRDMSKPHSWSGMAFGGGAYFEAVFSFANADDARLARWPSFWASDIENLSVLAVTELTQWLGEPKGYGNWIETDFFEYDRMSTGQYGVQIHNWYGYHAHNEVKDVTGFTSGIHVPTGFKWGDTHKYGFLWVTATAHTQGYVQVYLDDAPMGNPVYWNEYNPKSPPAPAPGTTAFSVLDARHLALILDTGLKNPMTVHSVTVWQKSAADNLTE